MDLNYNSYDQDTTLLGNGDILSELYEEITDAEVEELGIDIENERFEITTEEQANFFLRQLSEIRGQQDKINMTCNKEIERFTSKVNEFRAKRISSLQSTENYFVSLLENYARVQLADSKKKSMKTPFGTLGFKKGQAKFNYDEESLMKFIKSHELSQFIKIKEEINKKDLKAAILIDDNGAPLINGELVEGITITPGEEKFTVK